MLERLKKALRNPYVTVEFDIWIKRRMHIRDSTILGGPIFGKYGDDVAAYLGARLGPDTDGDGGRIDGIYRWARGRFGGGGL